MTPATPRFVADASLGRLARWLRILGIDVVYERHAPAGPLLRRAAAEERILLTRDRRLCRRRRLPPHLFIRSDDFHEQLRQVLVEFGIGSAPQLFGRCSVCNTELAPIEPERVRDRVPPYVFETQSRFSRCPSCDRVYWPATHVEHMRAEVRGLPLLLPAG